MDRRWQVTDFQRIVIYIAAVAAVFFAAMALGGQNLWLLLTAAGVLAVTVVGVFVVAGRRGSGAREIATARVISVAPPPVNAGIAARCDMQLEVELAGRAPVRTKHRDPAVPLTRWPQPGQTFPVEVTGGNPRRHLHIRWDLVEQGVTRAPGPTRSASSASPAGQAPMWEEENEPVIYSPTPPRPRRPAASPPPPAPPPPAPSGAPAAPAADASVASDVVLHETFIDVDEETARTPAPDHPDPIRTDPTRTDSNGHDPYGYDPEDFETPHLAAAPPDPAPAVTGGPGFEAVTLSDFDPAEIDIRDFGDEPSAVTAVPDEEDAGPPSAAPSGPSASPDAAARPIPMPRDPGGGARGGLAATLAVADLELSLGFYRDTLGFAVTATDADMAIVEHQGIRLRLERAGDGPRPPSGEIHLDVTDIDATCAAVSGSAGEVVEAPAPTHGGPGLRLWRARLHDPDGHAIDLTEWRHRVE